LGSLICGHSDQRLSGSERRDMKTRREGAIRRRTRKRQGKRATGAELKPAAGTPKVNQGQTLTGRAKGEGVEGLTTPPRSCCSLG